MIQFVDTVEIVGAAVGGAGAGGVAAYYAAKEAISVMIARLEERHNALKDRVDSDHDQLTELRQHVYSKLK